MAYNIGDGGNRTTSGFGSGARRDGSFVDRNSAPRSADLSPRAVPDDYVDQAERIMSELTKVTVEQAVAGTKCNANVITTSKLRNLFSILSDIGNDENRNASDTISEESICKLYGFRIRLVYEAGRDNNVKTFITQTNLLNYAKYIEAGKSRREFLKLLQYMEALVAYHRIICGTKEGR